MSSNEEVNSGTRLKCFGWSKNTGSLTDSYPKWFSTILYRSSAKINAIPLQKEVSNDGKNEQTMWTEKYVRALNNELIQKDKEISALRKQISEKQEQSDISQQESSQDSSGGRIRQTVPKEEHDRVLQEMNSMSDRLSLRDEEIDEKDEQIDFLKSELRRIDRLLVQLRLDPSNRQAIFKNVNITEDKTGQVSVVAGKGEVNKEKRELKDKNTASNRMVMDIVGAVPTPIRIRRPPKAPVSDGLNPNVPKFGSWDDE